jgi:Acetyltransferase (GNAT) domain
MNQGLGLMAADAANPAQTGPGDLVVCGDARALPADARGLLEDAGRLDIQNAAAWYDNFVQHVDLAPARPEFHVWRPQGRARLVLPLLRCGDRTLRELGNYYTTRWAPVVAAGQSDAQTAQGLDLILGSLLSRPGAVHTLQLGPLEAASADERLLQAALRRQGCAVFHVHAFQNWLLPVQTDWPAYLALRDGKLRTTLSRMSRRFVTRGGRLELLQGGPGLERAIAAYQTVYAASWKDPEPHPHFMPGLIRAAAASGQLRMALAWLGEEPVAAQVWMVAGGRADIYKLAHDERHKETSPGTLLTALLMQHVFEVDRVQWVDYLSGDDGYKRLWMTEVRERRRLLAFNLRTPRGLLLAAREAAARGVKAVLRRPAAS